MGYTKGGNKTGKEETYQLFGNFGNEAPHSSVAVGCATTTFDLSEDLVRYAQSMIENV